MKKENMYKFLYIISAILVVGFCIRLGIDYAQYDSTTSSAPFYAHIIERGIEFILPSIILFIGATIAKKKNVK